MKKLISMFLCALMLVSLFLPAAAAPYADSENPPCAHKSVTVHQGDKVGENCTTVTYNFYETCNFCGEKVRGGTMVLQKDPATHDFTWVTVGCGNGEHTYEYRCKKCGYASKSMTVKCPGNGHCIELQSVKGSTQ